MDYCVLKMEIKSKETTRPSSPTPPSQRNFQLSLLDQFSPPEYVPMIFYHAPHDHDITSRLQLRSRFGCLKHYLSLTLAKFYPLAGKVRENRFMECNDDGVESIEAEWNLAVLEVLQEASAEAVDQLLTATTIAVAPSTGITFSWPSKPMSFPAGE